MASEFKLKDLTSISLSPGSKQEVEVEGVDGGKVLLVNAGGKIQAIGAKCTHYGAPLANGVLTADGRVKCPWHGACFSTSTGDVEEAPALDALPVFKLIERNGAVYVVGDESAIKSSKRQPSLSCAGSSPAGDKVVVVGGGSGALGTVEGLREKGFTGGITVISNEGYFPIDRPKLSKALMTDLSRLQWRDRSWFDSGNVEWVDGEATAVDFGDRTVSTKNGRNISYTKLILATGGTARKLPVNGFSVLGNIFTLRNVHDVKAIVDAIGEKGKKIVIIGASFIGMEVANATCKDNTVAVADVSKVPLERVLGKKVGAGIQKAIEAKGVTFYLGGGIERAEPSTSDPSKVGAVVLKDGTKLEADLVILGVGVMPATEYLRDNSILRLEEDGSVKTDDNFQVSGLKDVYAIGDIATHPYSGPGGEGKPVRIEHWNVAQNSGRHVANHIVNPTQKRPLDIPIFWSALGAQLRYCGNTANGWDDVIVNGDPAEAKFVAYYTKGETVVAMASMGRDPLMSQSAELMRLNKMPSKKHIQDGVDVMSIAP
ncbi:Pyridine nucleotide-disulfide oxidoreductase, FAD/NAD(P)-binding domain protein [Metarhizium album ARSEF 1941]|uniref:Pyridine nucleotide-disulfide oxidoreductase, FAD/NAD(P)-binding domain protein n=1 Tax=Metarhizium album (strain ARSEF 1941) TaxID=1081103 RepID=A0A0B2WNQ3_METAS|nr:Pyridine nucleotide-disulfide oxidoreductase, FAD/NAD(P)-binding domain protein [Metarhizium album ARSEF 1941]KHN95254.1 Pyridine nucleotide-disulfide oxidoreductase, FAD/NAD(P)-binding domain protein [Metarhizium album ARSEF 1941]